MQVCKSCKTEDPKAFDDEGATYCVSCQDINEEIAAENAREDAGE